VRTERDVQTLLDTNLPARRMFLGEFDTWAVGSELVAKFPRSAVEAEKVRVEVAIHSFVRSLLGDVVPVLRMVGELDDGTGFPYMVHERATGVQGQTVEGVTIEPARGLAEHVGSLFSKLHTIGEEEALARGVGDRSITWDRPRIDDDTVDALTVHGGDEASTFLASSPPQPSTRRSLCHTDIKGEHIFVRQGGSEVTAIIDWADAEVCDPARDYAGLVIWLGPAFTRAAAVAGEGNDPTLADRAIWIGRAGVARYLSDMLAGGERAPMALIEQQIRTAFGP
jgi:aminoglycoside phosphotransferase (APT) family kinase protein